MWRGILLAVLLALGGCGGGDEGGGETSTPAPALTFSPDTVTASFTAGASLPINITATPAVQISGAVYVYVIDTVGVITPTVSIVDNGNGTYTATLLTSSALAAGRYQGNFEVRVCRDVNCTSQYGPPSSLPFDFTVSSSTYPTQMSISPASLNATVGDDETATLSITITPSSPLSTSVYVDVTDPMGRFASNVSVVANPGGTYSASITTISGVAPGHYQGTLEVRLCRDVGCTSQYAGSPVSLPYEVEVVAATNLTPLVRIQGVDDWEMFQGNAAHTGYVAATLDSSKFSRRWRWQAPDAGVTVKPVTVVNGSVFVATSGYFASSSKLFALSEADTSTRWVRDFGNVSALNPPSAAGGKVYVATSGHQDTFMWSFDATDGGQLFKTSFNAQWEHYYAPAIDASRVYTNGGYYGGMVAFDKTSGANVWTASLNQYDQWTPAIDANYAYAYIGESCSGCANAGLKVLDKATGAQVTSIADSQFNWNGWSINGTPVVGSNGSVVAVSGPRSSGSNRLISFDVGNSTIKWAIAGLYQGNPAVANGVVYATSKSPYRLEARRESDGGLLWSWSPNDPGASGFYGSVIVTDNMVFASTDKKVHALSLATHVPVWSHFQPGELALSANGILYIVTSNGAQSDGGLTAINLH